MTDQSDETELSPPRSVKRSAGSPLQHVSLPPLVPEMTRSEFREEYGPPLLTAQGRILLASLANWEITSADIANLLNRDRSVVKKSLTEFRKTGVLAERPDGRWPLASPGPNFDDHPDIQLINRFIMSIEGVFQ